MTQTRSDGHKVSFYRRRNKLKPEDWTEEIEKWEKYYMNDKYQIERRRKAYEYELREKERKERMKLVYAMFWWEKEKRERWKLLDGNGKFCGHYKKGEMDDGLIVCLKCGVEIGRPVGVSVGYNNRHHTMRSRKK